MLFCASPIGSDSCRMSSPRFVVWESEDLLAYLHPNPCTPGVTVLQQKPRPGAPEPGGLFQLPLPGYTELLLGARSVARLLCERLPVRRCALISEPEPPARLKLVPLHGLGPDWEPRLSGELEFSAEFRGYCCSKRGPRAADSELDLVQSRIRARLESRAVSYRFLGEPGDPSLFARIVRGEEEPQWRVWEDEGHVAVLTPFPNTPGYTVLAPRQHLPSDLFSLGEEDFVKLVQAARSAARPLREGLGAQSCVLIFEGYEVDYAHAKLVPVILGNKKQQQQEEGEGEGESLPPAAEFHSSYPGYVTSADGPLASEQDLRQLQARLRSGLSQTQTS
ncbi:uncharacterized protein LOC121306154 [Polyodon spathula]|uniref:uncharacterized protein LOC121306154 n=1 Tax=Polyodon spathula TaxID=7913 RepID=UPI001B7F1B55|nr:uncharacterized protein LOC121306154 [Polyodon spathula]